ncbi:hypothetical protein ACLD02_10070 [Alloalcanivorax sp. C16-2]|uniref:hypothetical protein n=1 Tax=Alloalcanivorax TaxID=3020832 RepID=UPI0019339CAE|nr:hypothetical protein [Alloalcanivorax marinus]MBL7249719.1 hypothetical protein [Alloalcanivorax marinus]
MSDNLIEDALGRALAYLRLAGLDADPALTRRALRLVDEMLEQGEDGLVERVMSALPERFAVPEPPEPLGTPPIHRGAIGYGVGGYGVGR